MLMVGLGGDEILSKLAHHNARERVLKVGNLQVLNSL